MDNFLEKENFKSEKDNSLNENLVNENLVNENSPEEKFHDEICDLADLLSALIEYCWNSGYKQISPGMAMLAKNSIVQYDKDFLIDSYIKKTNEYWNEIKERKLNFFEQNASKIFGKLPIGDVNIFEIILTAKNLKGEVIVTEEEIESIWNSFSILVKCSIEYIHKRRKCELKQKNNILIPVYTNTYMPTIKVRDLAELWNVKLQNPQI